jgi:general secretion pathway protein J
MKGFTLVEMLVALAALSILATGGVLLMSVSTDAKEILDERQADTTAMLRLRTVLDADLGQAAGRRPRDESGRKPQAALSGQPATRTGVFLQFVRRGWSNPLGQDRSSLQYVEYRLRDGRIERLSRRHVDGSQLQTAQLLLENVRSVRPRYFDFDQWAPNWSGAPNRPLPRAVGLDIELSDGRSVSQFFLLPETAS